MTREELLEALRVHGRGSSSFLLTYGGFEWFRNEEPPGLLAYVRSGRTLVVAGEPLCAREHTAAVLRSFARAMGRRCRIALLPVGGAAADTLASAGFGALQVGSEPYFDLATWRPCGDRAKKVRSAVNQARRTGVQVAAYRADAGRDPALEAELRGCADAWLAGRPLMPMRFLLALRPLDGAEEKRYFVARHGGRVVGFVACSPIYARRGWYLEDVVRTPDAPHGVTEMLVTAALHALAAEGAREATLGVSPLAGLEAAGGRRWIHRLLRLARVMGEPFYHFRGLHHYKKKYAPTSWEPVYVIFRPDRVTPGLIVDLVNAFLPRGIVGLVRDPIARRASTAAGWIAAASRVSAKGARRVGRRLAPMAPAFALATVTAALLLALRLHGPTVEELRDALRALHRPHVPRTRGVGVAVVLAVSGGAAYLAYRRGRA